MKPTDDADDPRELITEMLIHAANQHWTATHLATRAVHQGRKHGHTWTQLAAPLGLKPTTLQMRILRGQQAL